MQKEYDIQREEKQEEEKTEQIEKEEQVLPKREPKKLHQIINKMCRISVRIGDG